MIKVNVLKDNAGVKEIILHDHANYEVSGKDIVCASASSILITTVNALIKYQSDAVSVKKENKDTIHVTVTVFKHDRVIDLLLDNMLDLLKELSSDYPKNIKLEK